MPGGQWEQDHGLQPPPASPAVQRAAEERRPFGGGSERGTGVSVTRARASNSQLERAGRKGDTDFDLRRRVVLQGHQEVLDDAVPGQLHARGEQPGVTRHLEAGLRPGGLAQEPVELGEHRLGFGRCLVFQVRDNPSHVVQRLTAGALDGDESVLCLVRSLGQDGQAA